MQLQFVMPKSIKLFTNDFWDFIIQASQLWGTSVSCQRLRDMFTWISSIIRFQFRKLERPDAFPRRFHNCKTPHLPFVLHNTKWQSKVKFAHTAQIAELNEPRCIPFLNAAQHESNAPIQFNISRHLTRRGAPFRFGCKNLISLFTGTTSMNFKGGRRGRKVRRKGGGVVITKGVGRPHNASNRTPFISLAIHLRVLVL